MSGELAGLVDAIARVGASFLVHSTLLIGAALLAGRLLHHRAALRSAVYRATLAAVIALPLVAALADRLGVAFRVLPWPSPRVVGLPAVSPDAADARLSAVVDGAAGGSAGISKGEGPRGSLPRAPLQPLACAKASLAALWTLGSAFLLGHLMVCHVLLWRTRRRAEPIDDAETLGELRDLSAKFGVRSVALLSSPEIRSPILTGFFQPAILIPEADASAGHATLRAVLLHELGHLGRQDARAILVARVACAVFFFQPLAWLLARRMEESNDEVVDDLVLAEGVGAGSYARDLADWAERYVPARREAAAALGVVRFRSAVGRRVARILDRARRLEARVAALWAMGIFAGVLAASLLVVLLVARSQRPNVRVRVRTLDGHTWTAVLKPQSDGGYWVPISGWTYESFLWSYEGGHALEFTMSGGRVTVRQDGRERLAGLVVTDATRSDELLAELERGATGFTLWCDADDVPGLPDFPKASRFSLVVDCSGRDRPPVRWPKNGLERVLLTRCCRTLDVSRLGDLPVPRNMVALRSGEGKQVVASMTR